MLTEDEYRANYSSASAPDPVKVALPAYRNIYTYSALKLWAAYGVAIFLALLTALLGLVAIFLNGASYSNNFSTTFRAARGAAISEKVYAGDVAGEDPLPKRLAKAQATFVFTDADEKLRHRSPDR